MRCRHRDQCERERDRERGEAGETDVGHDVHCSVPLAALKNPGAHGVQMVQGGVVHSWPLSQGWHSCTSAMKEPPSPLYTP